MADCSPSFAPTYSRGAERKRSSEDGRSKEKTSATKNAQARAAVYTGVHVRRAEAREADSQGDDDSLPRSPDGRGIASARGRRRRSARQCRFASRRGRRLWRSADAEGSAPQVWKARGENRR